MSQKLLYLISFVLVLGLALNVPAGAEQFLVEHFNYANGADLNGQVAGKGAWETDGTNYMVLNDDGSGDGGTSSLQYPGLNDSQGGRLAAGDDPGYLLTTPVVGEGNFAYLSLLCKPTAISTSYFLHFETNGSIQWQLGRLRGRNVGGDQGFGVSIRGSGPAQWSDKTIALGETALVVIKLTMVPGVDNDIVEIWVNPTVGTPEPPADGRALVDSGNDVDPAIGIRGFNFRSSGEQEVDEIRFGTTWDDVAGGALAASAPSPEDEMTDVLRNTVLSWTSGDFAAPTNGHKVYFGESFNDVNDGIGGITQSATSYDAGRLKFGTTYYWRVDEISAPPDSTVYPGEVWSFTTELFVYQIENVTATASSSNVGEGAENTVNGSGVDANDLHSADAKAMWISEAGDPGSAWIQYVFDKPYKLHEMFVWNYNGSAILTLYGLKEVTIEYSTDGTNFSQLENVPEFAQAIGEEGYAANTTVAFNSNWGGGGGFFNQYGLSEVRFTAIPVSARKPSPDSGATGVDVDVILGWKAGREAASHDVYVSADPNALTLAGTVTEPAFDTTSLGLDLGQTYHWRVDEVNDAETTTTWQGGLWSFTTQEYRVVEDFESYNDLNPDDPESNRIFLTWIGGDDDPANGSQVGHDTYPFAELTTVHGGDQSTAPISVATRTFDPASDWTVGAPVSLSLYIRGMGIGDLKPANDGQPIYAVITDSSGQSATVSYKGGDATATVGHKFEAWVIPLADLAPVNLSSIKSIGIGVGTPGGAPSGAKGTVYVDLITLGLSTPAPAAGPKPTVWTEKASYSPFEPIVFHFTNADGVSAYDWIGFMVTGDPSSNYLEGYIYLDHVTDGSVTLEAGLGEFGIYDVRLFLDDSYIIEAANVFTIE